MPTKLSLPVPQGFRLKSVVFSHGWYDLAPFVWNADSAVLSSAITLADSPLDLSISQPTESELSIRSSSTVPRSQKKDLERIVGEMLGLHLDIEPFFAKSGKRFHWARELGLGRFLRGGSAFEDAVKMLATTNCSWSLTKLMTTRMVDNLGAVTPEGRKAFPTPKALAGVDLAFYKDEIRAGYRGDSFLRLAKRVADGELDIESWPKHPGDVAELSALIRAEKGCGPYVVDNLSRLFGRFDGLGIDSFCRRKFTELFGECEGSVDEAIQSKYKRFGRWQGLAMWLDLTKDWHVDKEFGKGKFNP